MYNFKKEKKKKTFCIFVSILNACSESHAINGIKITKQGRKTGSANDGLTDSNKVVQRGHSEKVTFKSRPKGDKGVRFCNIRETV